MFPCCWGHIVIRLTEAARRGPALVVICVMIDEGREEMALWFVGVKADEVHFSSKNTRFVSMCMSIVPICLAEIQKSQSQRSLLTPCRLSAQKYSTVFPIPSTILHHTSPPRSDFMQMQLPQDPLPPLTFRIPLLISLLLHPQNLT